VGGGLTSAAAHTLKETRMFERKLLKGVKPGEFFVNFLSLIVLAALVYVAIVFYDTILSGLL
jgi:hypothetical protein